MHSRTKEGAANGSERAKGVLSTQSNEQKKNILSKNKNIPNLNNRKSPNDEKNPL